MKKKEQSTTNKKVPMPKKEKKGSNWAAMKTLILKHPEESRRRAAVEANPVVSVSTKTKTKLSDLLNPDGKGTHANTPVIAMDCEMVGIGNGDESALARVSIVNYYGFVLYDSFVRPQSKIVDYRTKYSGIHPGDLDKEGVASLREAQNIVFKLMKNRIVVGHGISNDFEALMLNHPKKLIRDTATYDPLMFTNGAGKRRPHKLKYLLNQAYGENIQEGEHDSVDDARAALLVYRKHRNEWEKFILSKRVKGKDQEKKEETGEEKK